MPLPTTPTSSWTGSFDLPSRLFGRGEQDVELYEDEDAFVLTVEMPGFDPEEVEVYWNEGRLNVSAEHEEEGRNRRKTYHRSFRLPKEIEPDDIEAAYRNGVLEVRLPILSGAGMRGQEIEVET